MKKSLLLILSNCFVFGLLAQQVTITNATQTTSGFEYDFGQSIYSNTTTKTFTVNGLLTGESFNVSLTEDQTLSGAEICGGLQPDPASFSVNYSGGKSKSFDVVFNSGTKTYNKYGITFIPNCSGGKQCQLIGCNITTEPNTGQKSATLTITVSGGVKQVKRASAGVYTLVFKGNSVTTITSVEDVIQTPSTFYPNPATDRINCEGAFEIYDLKGQLLLEGYNEANISELSKGLYILKNNNKSTKLVKE